MRNGKLICQNANYSIDDVCYKRDEKLYNFWKGVKHGPGTIPEYYESNLGLKVDQGKMDLMILWRRV